MLTACQKDMVWGYLTPEQRDLLGRAVNFDATLVDDFKEDTKTTWIETGAFNEQDLMRIYRQYETVNGWGSEAYRTYYYNYKYATGTSVNLGKDWKVYKGRKGLNKGEVNPQPFTQTESDSLTWETGKAVRFRSWTRSNYAGALNNCYKNAGENGITNYYPDFAMSDWVTLSGPTEHIPLTLRHLCSRITIAYRNNGSQFYKAEVATSLGDYKWQDNSDTNVNDESETEHRKTDEQAQAELDSVLTAYKRMCMPAGVDVSKSELYAMKKAYWSALENKDADNRKLRYLEDEAPSEFYHFGTDTPQVVAESVQRPVFANVNNSCYLITIPYDMSNGPLQGDIITLPACTRFRIYMRDVNNGDGNSTGGYEGKYHIFSLSDIKDSSGNTMFPRGLDMLPGYSYKFYVGYRYNQLTITANDNFSWNEQDAEVDHLENNSPEFPETSTSGYSWWKNTIKTAIPTSTGGDFNPEFHISTRQEFIEFVNLVNGTAAAKTSGLYRAKRNVVNEEHKNNAYDKFYWWYSSVSANKRDTTWVTSADATADGYLFYESYHAANANQSAYSQEEYIRGAYPFYDETRDRHYTVYLDNDLDLVDWELESIGSSESNPFKGYFDGYFDGKMHTLRNINMREEYLFKYIDAAAIRNLKIESTHKVSLVKQGTNTCYIVGIDLRAHSTKNSIAESLTTNQYNNPSYVVGCIHVGDAGGALIGESGYLYMYGCMQAAEGIEAAGDGLAKAALVGKHLRYTSGSEWKFLTPQFSFDYTKANAARKPSWSRFMCNYFDTELSPDTWAVGDLSLSSSKDYSPLEYIRGRDSYILKAKNDNLLKGDVTFASLNSLNLRLAYYGLAPWKAMNYGIYRYNQTTAGQTHPCTAHYENNSTGYVHKYPELKSRGPSESQYANPLEQNN